MNGDIEESKTRVEEDSRLVEAVNSGDKASFDKLVLRYQDKVFNTCYRLLGDFEEANDSAQEVFVKVFRSLKNFRFESAFPTWLYRIAVNTCKNKLASSKYRQGKIMLRLDKPQESGESTYVTEIEDESLSPADEIDRREKDALIQKAINSLPEDYKTVVVLRDIEGLSYEETAKITGYNLGTVKSRLARARQRLRERLRGLV